MLRSILYVVSFGGIPWVTFVVEKVARCAIDEQGGKLTRGDFIGAATARLCGECRRDGEGDHKKVYGLADLLQQAYWL